MKGDVICSQDLTIDGVVEGTIEVGQHSLIIGVGASIKADLVGRVVTIGGSITGNVTATEKIDLKATGSIQGDVRTPRFAMAEGAIVRGYVETGNRAASR
jgi:cytoskeletal protein CcmA (bactofilin family)